MTRSTRRSTPAQRAHMFCVRLRAIWICAFALVACTLSACQHTINASHAPPPAIETPPQGESLVYFFRPELDRLGHREAPTLAIDGQRVARFEWASYTILALKPGRHSLKLTPGPNDPEFWNTAASFEVAADQTYFVAIWNAGQPGYKSRTTVPIFIPHVMLFFSFASGSDPAQQIRFEPVEPDVGVPALAGLRFIEAQATHLAPVE
jgi:hypothetical protein